MKLSSLGVVHDKWESILASHQIQNSNNADVLLDPGLLSDYPTL